MAFLAISSTGLAEALRAAKRDDTIWCGSDAISETDYAALKRPGVSRFICALEDPESIADVVGTIEEHHPGETIWIEAAPSNE